MVETELQALPVTARAEERARQHKAVADRLALLLEGEDDWIAALATVTCELHSAFEYFHWTGFYRALGQTLVIGPYQGSHGCLRIPWGKGVCGAAAATSATQLVPDVHAFPGHIACASSTASELVVPVLGASGAAGEGSRVLAVLDVDSDHPAAFTGVDAEALERLCADLGRRQWRTGFH